MRNLILSLVMLLSISCSVEKNRLVVITNSSKIDRLEEIIEIEIDNPQNYVVYNEKSEEIPSQVTYNNSLIFPVSVAANAKTTYTLKLGVCSEYDTVVCGAQHPEYFDDIAWESDKIGYRISGKPQLEKGRLLYGYDIFTKRVAEPVLDELYDNTFGAETQARVAELQRADPKAVGKYKQSRSYHIDHGKGMDYYIVGPTLGCGTSALVVDGNNLYPLYYSQYEFLDNGPLRVTLSLTFDPVQIGEDSVVESRIITLNAGEHFNYVEVKYDGLTKPMPIVAGVVLRDEAKSSTIGEGYLAYAEPAVEMGQTYDGLIFSKNLSGELNLFDDDLKKAHGGAFGYLQIESTYNPNTSFSYYMGAGWNKWGHPTAASWFDYVEQQSKKVAAPLTYVIE